MSAASEPPADGALYHIGFGREDLAEGTSIALLSGDPGRSELIATEHLRDGRPLSRHRGLDAFAARLPGGAPVVCATSGMGAPSTSIVVNELVQVGIGTIIRVGTSGSIQEHVPIGAVVIGSGALTNQGAARDIAPAQFPAVADPFLTVALAEAAAALGVDHHVGVMASVDTFYEGQERTQSSANPHLIRRLRGMIDEYHDLGILNFEMEAGTLFTMGAVYGFHAGAVVGIVAQRGEAEEPDQSAMGAAVDNAIRVAIAAADDWSRRHVPIGTADWATRVDRWVGELPPAHDTGLTALLAGDDEVTVALEQGRP
jgi:uridine phosphorylase